MARHLHHVTKMTCHRGWQVLEVSPSVVFALTLELKSWTPRIWCYVCIYICVCVMLTKMFCMYGTNHDCQSAVLIRSCWLFRKSIINIGNMNRVS
jgi:hypothetical protein